MNARMRERDRTVPEYSYRTVTIERTDPALHPGALFIGVYSLHETAFLVSARVREDPLEVPALNAVGSRVHGKYDG